MSSEDKTTDPLLEILAKVRSIDARLTDVDTRLTNVESRLTSLEAKVDERLRETRTIWQQALKEIMDTRDEQRQFRAHSEKEFKRVSNKIDLLHEDNLNLRTDNREVRNRLDALEHNSPTERIT